MKGNSEANDARIEVGSTVTVERYGGRRYKVEDTEGKSDPRLLLRPQELGSMPTPCLVSRGALEAAQVRGTVEVV